jgi:hypothetical protein
MAHDLYRILLARGDRSPQLKDVADEVQYFEKLHVFPGVEISVWPSLHLVLIFDESVVTKVTDFLLNDLELRDAVTTGDSKATTKHSAIDVLDKAKAAFADHYFCLLPHVDGSKGAWQELSGVGRLEFLTDDRVVAAQFLNPDSIEKITNTLKGASPQRKRPLGFIQASDYHGAPNVKPGQAYSLLKGAEPFTFQSLQTALRRQDGIQNSYELVKERLADYKKGKLELCFRFENKFDLEAKPDVKAKLVEALCAVVNDPDTVLTLSLLNISETADRGGEFVAGMVEALAKELDPSDSFSFEVAEFHQSTSRQCFCIRATANNKLRLVSGVCWVASGKDARPARAWEVERIVSRNFRQQYGRTTQGALASASASLLRISSVFPAMPIIARVGNLLSRNRPDYFSASLLQPSYPLRVRDDQGCFNGVHEGDCYVLRHGLTLKGGRQAGDQAYYRFTTPQFRYGLTPDEKTEKIGPLCVLLFPEGGVNFLDVQRPLYAPLPVFQIIVDEDCKLDPTAAKDRLVGLACWLKSSFVLWYIIAAYQTDDLFDVLIQRRRFPLPNDPNLFGKLCSLGRNAMVDEVSLLRSTGKPHPEKQEQEKARKAMDAHNRSVLTNMRLIDKAVLQHICAERGEIEEIYRVLAQLDLYDYGIGEDLEKFVKETTGEE